MPENALKQKLALVLQKIERARISYSRHQIVRLIAVSKYSDTEAISELYACGQRAFGESRVQDLAAKKSALPFPLEWHFIGNLQKNKINALLDLNVFLIHSVGSFALAEEINARCMAKNRVQKILLQINSAPQENPEKNGVHFDEAQEIYRQILKNCKNLRVLGVMSMGAASSDPREISQAFARTKAVFDALSGDGAEILSMGMSRDYELAIAHGANMIRVGSEIFRQFF